MRWGRHSATAIRSGEGYVIERSHKPGEATDTVFTCWSPGKQVIGGVSGKGIGLELAVAMCERHAERSGR